MPITKHVVPVDGHMHSTECMASDCACFCDPDVLWTDEDTGLALAAPIVVHVAQAKPRGWINKTFRETDYEDDCNDDAAAH